MNNNITDMIITGTAGIGKSRFFAMDKDKNPLVVLDKDKKSTEKLNQINKESKR